MKTTEGLTVDEMTTLSDMTARLSQLNKAIDLAETDEEYFNLCAERQILISKINELLKRI